MAFSHIQSLGKYVKLRSHFDGMQKHYMVERASFNMTPADLWKRIEDNKIQNNKQFDFFISHSLIDEEYVLKVIDLLNNQDFHVYCDWTSDNDFLKRELVSDFTKMVLKKRLEQSKYLLLVKTKNSLASNWVDLELNYLSSLNKSIYYIDLDEEIDKRLLEYTKVEHDLNDDYLQDLTHI